MRSIFRLYGTEPWFYAVEDLADWLIRHSESFDYDGASYDDALKVAEGFLKQENQHLEIYIGDES